MAYLKNPSDGSYSLPIRCTVTCSRTRGLRIPRANNQAEYLTTNRHNHVLDCYIQVLIIGVSKIRIFISTVSNEGHIAAA
jgi:hypothetical protein